MSRRLVFGGIFGLLVLGTSLVGCARGTPRGAPPVSGRSPTPAVSASVGAVPAVSASSGAAPPDPPAPAKGGWRTIAKEQGGFWLALDGLCPMLAAKVVGRDVLVSYGGGDEHLYLSDKNRVGDASFMALRGADVVAIDAPAIAASAGVVGTSLDDFWIHDGGGRRVAPALHRRHGGTWSKLEKDVVNVQPWVDGGVMGALSFELAHGEDLAVGGTKTAPPLAFYQGYWLPRFVSFATGEVTLLVGTQGPPSRPSGPLFARQWSTATNKVTHTPLPALGVGLPLLLLGHAPDEIYAGNDRKVAMFDGSSWKLLGTTSKKLNHWETRRAGSKGELWAVLEDGAIEVSGPDGFKPLKTPEKLVSFDGMAKGQTWAVGASGKLYRRDGETWIETPLPRATFSAAPETMKAKSVVVLAPDDIAVTAAYWEKGPGWDLQELHWALLRSKPQRETLRCNEPDPENNNIDIGKGFQSWPPMATAECETPFVVLSRRSKMHPPAPKTDWKKIKSALSGQSALLADGKLVEFVSGDRTFLGGRAKDVASGKKLAALASAKDRVRPEVVCAESPPAVREVPLD